MVSRKSKRMTKKRNTKKRNNKLRNNKIQSRNKIRSKKLKKKKNINRKYRKTKPIRAGMDRDWGEDFNGVGEIIGDLRREDGELLPPGDEEVIAELRPISLGNLNRIYIDIDRREEVVTLYDNFSTFKRKLQSVGILKLNAGEDIVFKEKTEDDRSGDIVPYEDLKKPENLLKTFIVCKTGSHKKEKKPNKRDGEMEAAAPDDGVACGVVDSSSGIFKNLKNFLPVGNTEMLTDAMQIEE